MVCDLRALGWAAGCRPERPSWPLHLDQLHRSGLAVSMQLRVQFPLTLALSHREGDGVRGCR